MQVAWIGLGAMGAPMAARLGERFPTLVHNRTESVARAHADEHATRAVPLAETASADVLFTCLPTSAEVVAVAGLLEEHLRRGTTWIDCTSGSPQVSRELAARLAGHGVDYLDAPVSGGTDGATAGTLTVMIGGREEALAHVRPVLEVLAARIVHVGPVGAGHAVKAVNNTLLALNLWAAGEGLAALAGHGVPASVALDVINASSGRSNASERLIPERVVTRSFPNTFALGLLEKDIRMAQEVLDSARVPAPALRLAGELYRVAAHELGPDVDHTEALRLVERWAGSEIR